MERYEIDTAWVPPILPELKLVERGGSWLCLNPEVPSWFGTTKTGALLLQLVDGKRSISDYHEMLRSNDVPIDLPQIMEFFQSGVNVGFFQRGYEESPTGIWDQRRLSAIYLHLTDRCNLQCTYCYRESSPHIPIRHEPSRFVEMLEFIKPFSTPNMKISFSGGEPMTYPGFEEVVATSTRLGYKNMLLTNATLITDKKADFIAEHFGSVKISVDGPNEEIHARTRGEGNFSKVIQGIERLAERRVPVKVQVTVAKSNLPFAEQIKGVLPDVPHVTVSFTPLMAMGRGNEVDEDFLNNDVFHSFSRGLARATSGKLSNKYVPGQRSRRCHAGMSSLSIADTGEVYPCHLFHADAFNFGNIFHDSFEDIFFSDQVKQYVHDMDVEQNNPVCKNCEVRFLCGGGCHANTLHAKGDFRGVDTYCSYLKKTIFDDLFTLVGHEGEDGETVEVSSEEGSSSYVPHLSEEGESLRSLPIV